MKVEMNLLTKIKSKKAVIGIVGLGYVGLPLAFAFRKKKFKVIGFDIDQKKINSLDEGKSFLSHISDKDISKMNLKNGFTSTTDFSRLTEVDAIIICVPTPLSKFKKPDLEPVFQTGKTVSKYLKKGQIVVLESSTYPGTTNPELKNILERSGLSSGKDFYLAYSPEREDPGNKNFSTSIIPKIVGADDLKTSKLVFELYKQVISKVVEVSSTQVAEAAKLTENIFRSVNIALVNELKVIYDEMGIDVWEVIEAASTKPFGFMPFYPGPGLGGHCIPIDPFYLTYKAKEFGINTKFIELAGEINTNMPNIVINKLTYALSEFMNKSINKSKILIIGMAYKKDVDDMRESPSLILYELLQKYGAHVDYHDDYVKQIPPTREHKNLEGLKSVKLSSSNLKKYDALLISTDHSYINYKFLSKNSDLIIDTRNAMDNIQGNAKVVKA
jgi:UDP-N-acetyl-D-glucosamine dehydrogenase